MADWNHSAVIYSLLQRPEILVQWNDILQNQSKGKPFIGFGWDPNTTRRVEGFPDSDPTPQLQDKLEYFTLDEDAAALAQDAYDHALKKVARSVKNADGDADGKTIGTGSYKGTTNMAARSDTVIDREELRKESDSWRDFVRSMVEDDFLPSSEAELDESLWSSWL
jgi:hypothetical protein